jgi:transcriptional regulator with XRE-family HTH domain
LISIEEFLDWRKMIMKVIEHRTLREIKKVILKDIEKRRLNEESLRSIAKKVGLSSSTIIRICDTRNNHNPKISTLLALSKALCLFSSQPRSTEELLKNLRKRLRSELKPDLTFSDLRFCSNNPKEEYALKIMVSRRHFSYTLSTLNTLLNTLEMDLKRKITIEDLGFQKK